MPLPLQPALDAFASVGPHHDQVAGMILKPPQHTADWSSGMKLHLHDTDAKLAGNSTLRRVGFNQTPASERAAHGWKRVPARLLFLR